LPALPIIFPICLVMQRTASEILLGCCWGLVLRCLTAFHGHVAIAERMGFRWFWRHRPCSLCHCATAWCFVGLGALRSRSLGDADYLFPNYLAFFDGLPAHRSGFAGSGAHSRGQPVASLLHLRVCHPRCPSFVIGLPVGASLAPIGPS